MVADPTRSGPLFDAAASLHARLLLAFPDRQWKHHVLPPRVTRGTYDRIAGTTPFVGRGFLKLEVPPETGRRFRCRAHWSVVIGLRNITPDCLLLGDGQGVGQLGVLTVAIQMLHGWIEKDLGTWSVSAAENLYSDEWAHDEIGLIALGASMLLEVVDGVALAAEEPDFLRLGVSWNLPPLAAPDEPVLSEQVITVRTPDAP